MEYNELLELLDIETPQDFQYFENMAALIECEYQIPAHLIFKLFKEVNDDNAIEIIEEYFNDMLEGVPDSEGDIYSIIDNERTALCGLINSDEGDKAIRTLSEEIENFREWYVFDSKVYCTSRETGEESTESVRDALTMIRAEKFGGACYDYDFSQAANYQIDEFVFSIGSSFEGYDDEDEHIYGPGEEKEELLNSNFLYDDELSDY